MDDAEEHVRNRVDDLEEGLAAFAQCMQRESEQHRDQQHLQYFALRERIENDLVIDQYGSSLDLTYRRPMDSGIFGMNAAVAFDRAEHEGTGDAGWLDGLDELVRAAQAFEPVALVVPLGVDAGADDPESPFTVTSGGFRDTGRRIGALGVPTVFVQEGGYELASLGGLVLSVLEGFEEARA